MLTEQLVCKRHGLTDYKIDTRRGGGRKARCIKCAREYTHKRRRVMKRLLVDDFGGKCSLCGYNRCISALHFHHLDSTKKVFGIAKIGSESLEKVRTEAKKCILVCANCHAEIEAQSANGEATSFSTK